MFPPKDRHVEHNLGYQELRTLVGLVGMVTPFVLALGGFIKGIPLQPSLSAYYHTSMLVPFIGSLWVIAFFMMSYRGFHHDWIWGNLAALFAVCVTLFPIEEGCGPSSLWSTIHSVSALLYFSVLIYFSAFLFTKSKLPPSKRSRGKKLRNAVYRGCAAIMAVCVASVMIWEFTQACSTENTFVFWMESTAIFFFGVSWFVKGGLILRDKK